MLGWMGGCVDRAPAVGLADLDLWRGWASRAWIGCLVARGLPGEDDARRSSSQLMAWRCGTRAGAWRRGWRGAGEVSQAGSPRLPRDLPGTAWVLLVVEQVPGWHSPPAVNEERSSCRSPCRGPAPVRSGARCRAGCLCEAGSALGVVPRDWVGGPSGLPSEAMRDVSLPLRCAHGCGLFLGVW